MIRDGSIVSLGRERPDLGCIEKLYGKVVILEQKYGVIKRLGLHKSIEGKRLRCRIKRMRRRLYAYKGFCPKGCSCAGQFWAYYLH